MSRRSAWWPGGGEGSAPSGFPGVDRSSEDVTATEQLELPDEDPTLVEATVDLEVEPPQPRRSKPRRARRGGVRTLAAVASHWPGQNDNSAPPDFPTGPVEVVSVAEARPPRPGARARVRNVPTVIAAVYTALADPLVGGDPAARELRAARIRRVGMVTLSAGLAFVLIYAFFPVSTYLDQRAATQRARESLEKISQENERLAEEAERLRTPEEVEKIARRDYGLVFPGEELYGVLPSPTETTTTTTTAPPPPP